MRLCMFHPSENPMERGWVGRIDGERMIHLAAQTLQSLFLNGGTAREHAVFPLEHTTVLVPVQYPPNVRVFDGDGGFRFANATAVVGDATPVHGAGLTAVARVAALVGAGGEVGGWSALVEWQDPAAEPAVKRTDVGLVLGPTVVTPDEVGPSTLVLRLAAGDRVAEARAGAFAWDDALAVAARGTSLRPGDLLVGPPVAALEGIDDGVVLETDVVGTLQCPVAEA